MVGVAGGVERGVSAVGDRANGDVGIDRFRDKKKRCRLSESWDRARADLDQLVKGEAKFASETLLNALEFINFASSRYEAPDAIAQGYWPTVCISWSSAKPAPIQIEIHEDRYEFYRFFDGRTDIEEFLHIPGDPIPGGLTTLMDGSSLDR
jgi:hypothetical protein